jgi:hypothetical protein
MKVRLFVIVVIISVLTACGTQQTPKPEVNIVPSTCQVKPEHKIPLTVQDSGNVKRQRVDWFTMPGTIEKQGDGIIAIYTAPKESGNQYIIATVYYVDGTDRTATIICEVLTVDMQSTSTPVFEVESSTITTQIKVQEVSLFSGPGSIFPIIPNACYYQGTFLVILAKNDFNDWFLVKAPNNVSGWVYRDWIELSSIDISQIPLSSFIPTSQATQGQGGAGIPTSTPQPGELGRIRLTLTAMIKIPPTDVPPTDIPPTDIPPTDIPPTDIPPTP